MSHLPPFVCVIQGLLYSPTCGLVTYIFKYSIESVPYQTQSPSHLPHTKRDGSKTSGSSPCFLYNPDRKKQDLSLLLQFSKKLNFLWKMEKGHQIKFLGGKWGAQFLNNKKFQIGSLHFIEHGGLLWQWLAIFLWVYSLPSLASLLPPWCGISLQFLMRLG